MALSSGPNLGLLVNGTLGEAHYAELMRLWRGLDALVQSHVFDIGITDPSTLAPDDGDCFTVGVGATGVFASHDKAIARWSDILAAWEFYAPLDGWTVFNYSDGFFYEYKSVSSWTQRASGGSSGGRELLTADRTYYVATTGSDSNDGLTIGTPFLTIQKAVDVANALDASIYQVTIQVADGTYGNGFVARAMLGTKDLVVVGNVSNPANAVIASTGSCIEASGMNTVVKVNGFTLQSSTGYAIGADGSGTISFGNIVFGVCAWAHLYTTGFGTLEANAAYSISGNAPYHWRESGGSITVTSTTITLSGSRTFSGAFALANRGGKIICPNNTYSGSAATGVRYALLTLGLIDTDGAATTALPGSVAGTTATGGQYA